jgi:hypothetical protein
MNDIKPNEPFNSEEEKEAYNEYKKSESYVKHNGEDIPVYYKTDIKLNKGTKKNNTDDGIPF